MDIQNLQEQLKKFIIILQNKNENEIFNIIDTVNQLNEEWIQNKHIDENLFITIEELFRDVYLELSNYDYFRLNTNFNEEIFYYLAENCENRIQNYLFDNAKHYHKNKDYIKSLEFCFMIKTRNISSNVYKLMCNNYYHLNDIENALKYKEMWIFQKNLEECKI
jgi:outer membrane receptor for ferric coprogen and ferric-rhodotorulic acid